MIARTLAALACLALLAVPTAAAHKTDYSPDGAIKIVWGFLNEPAVTDTKNGLDLRIQYNATGYSIPGLEDDLQASISYGDEKKTLPLSAQFGKPGYYTSVITPTRPGLYTLHLKGTVNGTALDMAIPAAHEMADIRETYFPEAAEAGDAEARIAALEAKVAALEAKATSQSQTTTPVTTKTTPAGGAPVPALGLLGVLAAAGLVLALRRRS